MNFPARFVSLLLALGAAASAGPFEDTLAEGKRLLADGKPKEAVVAFDKAIALKPASTEALVQRGQAWFKQEKMVRALDDFDEARRLEPANAAALAGRAQVLFWKGEWEQAKENAEAAIKADDRNAEAHFILGRVHLNGIFWDRNVAIYELTRAIELDPKMAWAYYARSGVWKNTAQWERGFADVNKAIELESREPHFYEGRAGIHEQMKRDDEALKDFDKAIELDPDNHVFLTARGKLHARNKRTAKAMADLNAALRLRDNYPGALVARGSEHARAGQMDKAARDFDEAVRGAPQWPLGRAERGWFRLKIGKTKEAVSDLNQAISLGQGFGDRWDSPYANLSEAHFQLGHWGPAAKAAREAMKRRDPAGDPHAYSAILGALAEQRMKHPARVRELLEAAQSNAKPESWRARVVVFLSGKGSAEEFLAAAKDDGQRTEAHFYTGHALLVQEKPAEAKAHFEWVRDHGKKDFTEYGLALAELTRLAAPTP